MKLLYQFSPLLIFVFGYLLWTGSAHNSPLVLAGNGLIVLAFVMILALIPAGIIYARQKRRNTSPELIDDQEQSVKNPSFYFLLSKFVFYIGFSVCLFLLVMKLAYSD